jgi:hypothetical protein
VGEVDEVDEVDDRVDGEERSPGETPGASVAGHASDAYSTPHP